MVPVYHGQSFLREIAKNVPKNLEVHIIMDNYATHKHLRVRRWFATRPRFHVHFTPTYASWLNQVEIWFNRITQQALRRGTFSSDNELVQENRPLRPEFQPPCTSIRLDCHRGFNLR
jgi:putative transposase